MIIVDGPDNVGKTTFIKKLANALGFSMRSFGQEIQKWDRQKLKDEIIYDCTTYTANAFAKNIIAPADIVYDRFHMSCFVYGKVIRKLDILTASDCKFINKQMIKNVYTILILPYDIEEYKKSIMHSDRSQAFNINQNVAIAECFDLHAEYFRVNDIIYVTKYPGDNYVEEVVFNYKIWRYPNEDEALKEVEATVDETKQGINENTSVTSDTGALNHPVSKGVTDE